MLDAYFWRIKATNCSASDLDRTAATCTRYRPDGLATLGAACVAAAVRVGFVDVVKDEGAGFAFPADCVVLDQPDDCAGFGVDAVEMGEAPELGADGEVESGDVAGLDEEEEVAELAVDVEEEELDPPPLNKFEKKLPALLTAFVMTDVPAELLLGCGTGFGSAPCLVTGAHDEDVCEVPLAAAVRVPG